jgi:lipopolysaccharide/colanic/teichoic acid biosynthesis glycosyltransferase
MLEEEVNNGKQNLMQKLCDIFVQDFVAVLYSLCISIIVLGIIE